MKSKTPKSVLESLPEKQQLFVREYLKDLHQTHAAIRAGYSEKTAAQQANRLLKNVKIQQAIGELRAERNARINIDVDYVIKTIVETVERCNQASPVLDKHGDIVLGEAPDGTLKPIYKYDATNVLKGAELLGRHLAMFTDKTEISGGMAISTISDLMDDLADDETTR